MIRHLLRLTCLLFASLLFAAALPTSTEAQIHFRPILGSLPADSGLAAGFELLRYRTLGPFDARARFVGSIKKYEHAEFSLESPPPATHNFFSEFRLRYRNYPEEDFWGLGPDSIEQNRSNYRLEDIWLTGTAGLHFRSGLRVAAVAGLAKVNIGPGRDNSNPATDTVFPSEEAPALRTSPDYWRGGLLIDYDRRDDRENPRTGDLASFEWTRYTDRDPGDFNFDRYAIEYRRFFSLSESRRIAGRARIILTDAPTGHAVPFYMQPSVGGTDTVRGFHQYRFRSGSSLLLNVEYRQAWLEFLDVVGFADAGRVLVEPGDLSLNSLEGSVGAGARVRVGGRVFFGVDLGFSREGARLWFRSGNIF